MTLTRYDSSTDNGLARDNGLPRDNGLASVEEHLRQLDSGLRHLHRSADELRAWGVHLALSLARGGRLLTAGNGGSAAHAQHLAGELVGRFQGERMPLSAIALTADAVVSTAIGNDYGYETLFARQVHAHARAGDIVILLSTSGGSPNVVAAAQAAHEAGAQAWAMTGPAPNPLAQHCDRLFAVPEPTTAIVQEVHQVAVHVLCGFVDEYLHDLRNTHVLAHLGAIPDGRAGGPLTVDGTVEAELLEYEPTPPGIRDTDAQRDNRIHGRADDGDRGSLDRPGHEPRHERVRP